MGLTEQLKTMIENHLERFPSVSINALSMRSGVGATTLRRILSSAIKGDPAPHTILSIVSVIYKEKKLSQLLKMVEGPLGEHLRETFGQFLETQAPHKIDTNLNEVLSDPISYFIYKLSANRAGTTRKKVLELFGTLGKEKLESLLREGFIVEEGKTLHAKEKDFSLDLETAKKHLPELVNFFKPEEVSEGRNLFYTLSESLNDEGIQKIKEIQKEAVKKIFEIMSSKEYAGHKAYFTVNLSDTMEFYQTKGVLQ